MRMTAVLLLAACLHVSAAGNSQKVTISRSGAHLEEIFNEIRQQTGYLFFYNVEWLRKARKVDVHVYENTVEEVLDLCFKDQPVTYSIIDRTIVIKQNEAGPPPRSERLPTFPARDIKGKVTDEEGNALSGVSVMIKASKTGTQTDGAGDFVITVTEERVTLVFSMVGFQSQEIVVRNKSVVYPVLKRALKELDETVVIAYGKTTKRFNTGSVSKVTAEEISKQPVSNPLAALMGRAPGLIVQQQDGLTGGAFHVRIRGRGSLLSDYRPLFLVDGVPFTNESMTGSFPGTNSYSSPLNSINPEDIESIEVLKDADATAIYGSRGANGVVMITTKKGKVGKMKVDVKTYSGFTKATRYVQLMNTAQYLEMRREAFRNDGITPTVLNAPDLLVWDTTRQVNWQDLLLGGKATTSDLQTSISGGTANIQYRLGLGYHHETPLYEKWVSGVGYTRLSGQINLTQRSGNNKFSSELSVFLSRDNNKLAGSARGEVTLPPNAPYPYDNNGKLIWEEGGARFPNPFAGFNEKHNYINGSLTSNLNLRYQLVKNLEVKGGLGYNQIMLEESRLRPKSMWDPAKNMNSAAFFTNNYFGSWVAEPLVEYNKKMGRGELQILTGASWQEQKTSLRNIQASDYLNDLLISSTAGAQKINARVFKNQYRYTAFFGRLNINWDKKYIFNLSGRRDGSTRFGPGRQFANFGAAGLAWIFTEENGLDKILPFLSFGKIRGSYGVTGNDAVGDYQFLDTWNNSSSSYIYDGTLGLQPSRLFNENYAWETSRKLEVALDLGLFDDRLLLNAGFYRNRSGNQLLNYRLPSQTGFSSILRNFPAVVQNSGWEFDVSSTNIITKKFQWKTDFNLSIPKTILYRFPALETSSYFSSYIVGEPLELNRLFEYRGVDPQTGIYQFNGTNFSKDRTILKDRAGKFYGGISNTVKYQNLQVDVFFQVVNTLGSNYIGRIANAPGTMLNQPVEVLGRWQKPGDETSIQRYSTTGAALTAFSTYRSSNQSFTDASFIRCKNVSVSYSLPQSWLNRVQIKQARIFAQGQNLFVITRYKGGDPESFGIGNPLLRVMTGGIHISF